MGGTVDSVVVVLTVDTLGVAVLGNMVELYVDDEEGVSVSTAEVVEIEVFVVDTGVVLKNVVPFDASDSVVGNVEVTSVDNGDAVMFLYVVSLTISSEVDTELVSKRASVV